MRVTVLGTGIVGLTTAVRLAEAGCQVRMVSDAPIEASTSYLAAAVWFPTHVGPADRVPAWGSRTYRTFAADAACGDIPGIMMRETLVLYRQQQGVEPAWVASVGAVRPARPAELPAGYREGLRFVVPLVEMPRYLPWLVARVIALGCELVRHRVTSIGELAGPDVDAIVNCSGLAARTLVPDPAVYPVRGQIVRVTNPGLDLSVRDEDHPDGRAYVHPRSTDCILGGTLDEHSWDTSVDLVVAESILRRCREMVPALAHAAVIEHLVGLRPGRPAVRLEECNPHPVGTRVLHNYGHGGSGVTLSWGCADEITALLLAGIHGDI